MRTLIWTLALGTIGCAGKKHIKVMEPAQISVPQPVQTLALVDRQANKHSFRVMYSLRDAITAGPRFGVVDNTAAQNALARQAVAAGQNLSKRAARSICAETNATGIVSLERFLIDDGWSYDWHTELVTESQFVTRTQDGEETTEAIDVTKEVKVHEATFSANLETEWSLYDCDGNVLDTHAMSQAQSWQGEGQSKSDARLEAGEAKKLRAYLLGSVGRSYRARVSPFSHEIQRRYYRGGNHDLRAGHRAAQANDWVTAEREWASASKRKRARARAKAWHNLALLHEQQGDLDTALSYASRAADVLGKGWVKHYPQTLRERLTDQARVEQQLGIASDE